MSCDIEMSPMMDNNEKEIKIEVESPDTTLSMHTSEDEQEQVQLQEEHEQEHQFLVSFMVDAQGGTMRGCRQSGVRVVIPPKKASMPTRITCQYLKRDKDVPNPLMEGEIKVSKVLKLGPAGAQFLGPVMIEIPHCNQIESNDRELFVLRYDSNGHWSEHTYESSNTKFLDESFDQENDVIEGPSTKIFTESFPQCFLIASRIKLDHFWIGPEGRVAHSSVMPEVKACFEPNVVSRKVKIGMQILHLNSSLNISPVVTIEPRRERVRKGKYITMTIPMPKTPLVRNNLRLISSITSGTSKSQWQDLTNQAKLEINGNMIKFKTAGLARFCLIETENHSDAIQTVTKLYKDAIRR